MKDERASLKKVRLKKKRASDDTRKSGINIKEEARKSSRMWKSDLVRSSFNYSVVIRIVRGELCPELGQQKL